LSFKKVFIFLFLSVIVVTLPSNLIAFAVSPLNITLNTDKTYYILRDNVDIYGNVTYNDVLVDKGLAGIQVNDPLGALFVIRTRLVGPIGSQTFPVQITQATLSDMYGNPLQTVVRPNTSSPPVTYFTIRVKNNGAYTTNVLITGNIYDNDSIPIGTISYAMPLVGHGWANVTQGIYIATWAKTGTATIYANVYTDWPNNNGHPVCPEKNATFAILESSYDESLPGQAPQQNIENGTYHVIFRLSPEPRPGTYEAYATAYQPSSGWATELPILKTFHVNSTSAAPRASFVIAPPRATINYDITFDAASSTPEGFNQTITNYKWDFGDGNTTMTAKIVKHHYTSFGNYTVKLNVTDSEGLWNTTTKIAVIKIIHDVAILNMSCLNAVFSDWKTPVYVRVKNRGTVPETFNVTVYAEGHVGGTNRTNNLAAYATSIMNITWNTAGLTLPINTTTPLTNDILTAIADTVSGETNTANNICTYGLIQIRFLGDINGDRKLNILDLVSVTTVYGSKVSYGNWKVIVADLYPDGKIDISDIVKLTANYGKKY
jgi:PKD repeat protein